jgi:hypothetical protein
MLGLMYLQLQRLFTSILIRFMSLQKTAIIRSSLRFSLHFLQAAESATGTFFAAEARTASSPPHCLATDHHETR